MISKKNIKDLPRSIGVYLFKKGKEVLYVGKSVDIYSRIASHLENAKINNKEKALIREAEKIEYQLVDSEFKALIIEAQLIKKYQPKYNSRWRDDKNFLWIKITVKEEFPKVYLVRKENDNQSVYFGPFSGVKEAEMVLREARKIIPFCSEKKINKKPCFYSKIGLCNPCPNVIYFMNNKKEKERLTKKYQKNIQFLIELLQGNNENLSRKIHRKIKSLVNQQKFEEAIIWREILKKINYLLNKKINLDNYMHNDSIKELKKLEEFLKQFFPSLNLKRIEGFDISNLSFREGTASMVVFIDGIADKSQYRKFKIKTNLKSDVQMLAEALERRLNNPWPLPQLFLIDGGTPQLKAASLVLNQKKINIPILALAKNPDRIVFYKDKKIIKIPISKIPGNLILRSIRDESHRFAKKYHLLLRSKRILGSNIN